MLDVTPGSQGRWWITHGNVDSLSVFDGYTIRQIPSPGATVAVREGPTGQLWSLLPHPTVLEVYVGLQLFENGRWTAYRLRDLPETATAMRRWHFVPWAHDRVLVLSPDALIEFDRATGAQTSLVRAADTGLRTFTELTPAADGGVWIGGRGAIGRLSPPDQAGRSPLAENRAPSSVGRSERRADSRGATRHRLCHGTDRRLPRGAARRPRCLARGRAAAAQQRGPHRELGGPARRGLDGPQRHPLVSARRRQRHRTRRRCRTHQPALGSVECGAIGRPGCVLAGDVARPGAACARGVADATRTGQGRGARRHALPESGRRAVRAARATPASAQRRRVDARATAERPAARCELHRQHRRATGWAHPLRRLRGTGGADRLRWPVPADVRSPHRTIRCRPASRRASPATGGGRDARADLGDHRRRRRHAARDLRRLSPSARCSPPADDGCRARDRSSKARTARL